MPGIEPGSSACKYSLMRSLLLQIACFFSQSYIRFHCLYKLQLLEALICNWDLSCFHILVIILNAAINIVLYISFKINVFMFWEQYHAVVLLIYIGMLFLFLKHSPYYFSYRLNQIIFHRQQISLPSSEQPHQCFHFLDFLVCAIIAKHHCLFAVDIKYMQDTPSCFGSPKILYCYHLHLTYLILIATFKFQQKIDKSCFMVIFKYFKIILK